MPIWVHKSPDILRLFYFLKVLRYDAEKYILRILFYKRYKTIANNVIPKATIAC
ncbi:hypothetical protein AY601_2832 [Pedobacter cryoconitis]|uniref:Uncharacterized protein n=1 Tax=Pedobacter cryoconitis TaxID=188932 RepID=A0A127VEE1_9SPHI|nr:hypothetical protein AY601_2832 [Pedobacter cryoconitis]